MTSSLCLVSSANCSDCLLSLVSSQAHPVWHQAMSPPVQAVGAAASLAKTQNGKVTVLLVDVQEPGLEEATTRSEALAWQFREAGFEHFEILSKVGGGPAHSSAAESELLTTTSRRVTWHKPSASSILSWQLAPFRSRVHF